MPSQVSKRLAQDVVYASRPTLKQKIFPARSRRVKTSVKDADDERPVKRRKKQATMTQLDFGRRSFSDAIGDSEDDVEIDDAALSPEPTPKPTQARKGKSSKSELPGKTENQPTLTQYIHRPSTTMIENSEDEESMSSEIEPVKTNATKQVKVRRMNSRRSLPVKTESQDTMTQFVKRRSNSNGPEIQDSEDEETDLQEDQQWDVAASPVPALNHEKHHDKHHMVSTQLEPEQVEAIEINSSLFSASKLVMPQPKTLRTPKRVRVLPVPDSRSPDSPFSIQRTPRRRFVMSHRSPLQEKSVNFPTTLQTRSQDVLDRNDFSVRKDNIGVSQAQDISIESTPTRRRVREFNARFAFLEQENAEQRGRRSLDFNSRPRMIRSSTSLSSCQEQSGTILDETQYSAPGQDTQSQFIRMLEAARELTEHEERSSYESPRIQQAVPTTYPNSLSLSCDIAAVNSSTGDGAEMRSEVANADINRENDDVATIRSGQSVLILQDPSGRLANVNGEAVSGEAILIPSSQEKRSSDMLNSSSLPQVIHIPKRLAQSTQIRRDLQDLASDQLYRETQAFLDKSPSSLEPEVQVGEVKTHNAETSSQKPQLLLNSSQPPAWLKQSQATTMDESLPTSTCKGPAGLPWKPQDRTENLVMSSSPILLPEYDEDAESIVIGESPTRHPPELVNVNVNTSSSPKLPEPRTPNLLRNLKIPITMSQLMSESLEQSIPMPPRWMYDEDDEDDEL